MAARKHPGRRPALTPQHKVRVRRWISGKDPRQDGFDFGLWTRNIVRARMQEQRGVTFGVTAIGRLWHERGITPQNPLRRADARDPIALENWTRTTYPRLTVRATRRTAQRFFLDEAGVRSDQVLGRTWGANGKTPAVPTSGQRHSLHAISAGNARGAFWYAVYAGRCHATRFKEEFLTSVLRGRTRPVFLVVDGHPAHRATIIASYVNHLKGRLEWHFVPGDAPELNPDEFVWNEVTREGTRKKPLHRNESLRQRVDGARTTIKRRPAVVRSFFRAPSLLSTKD